MRSKTRRLPSVVAALAVIVALVVAACGGTTTSASPAASTAPAASAAPVASASAAAAHEPVSITVGVLRPGATQAAVDALNLQISEFEAKYPVDQGRARGVQLDGADVHGRTRGRHAP